MAPDLGITVRITLIYPPLLDPTSPYHSLSYIKAAAVAHGYPDTQVVDANIGAIRHVLAPDFVAAALVERRTRRHELLTELAQRQPEPLAASESRELAELLKLDLVDEHELQNAVGILTDAVQFYDIRSYRWAVDRIVAWMSVLATVGIPGQFRQGFRLSAEGWSPSKVSDLTNRTMLARISGPFEPYVQDTLLPALVARRPDVIGLNLTFTSQLPFALRLLGPIASVVTGARNSV